MDDFPAVEPVDDKPKKEIDFMKLLESPIAQNLLGMGKDIFKKEKVNPNICEISIKAPSEVVLKIFGYN